MTLPPSILNAWTSRRRPITWGAAGVFAAAAAVLLLAEWSLPVGVACGVLAVLTAPVVVWQSLRWDRHFSITWMILLASAAGWGTARELMGFVTQKSPVPWPAQVVAVEDGHRMISLPKEFGNFKIARNKDGNGVDHGEAEIDFITDKYGRDTLITLGIATDYDNSGGRFENRSSNWYVWRRYEDNRPQHKQQWHLAVYYYTGGLDLVPHIPDICLEAGGNKVLASDTVPLLVPGAQSFGWKPQLAFFRTLYQQVEGGRQFVEYYIFSLNGESESSSLNVRLKLPNPFKRYSYFAKIQFGPQNSVRDLAESDREAAEFMQAALPEILKLLPTRQDVDKLQSRK